MKKKFLQYLSIIGISSASLAALAPAAELQHFWDFEGDEWWLDKVGLDLSLIVPGLPLSPERFFLQVRRPE